MRKLRPPVKIFGGKSFQWPWIVAHFPKKYWEMNYVEGFCGGGSVFLNKRSPIEPCYAEYISDVDSSLIDLWKTIKYHPRELMQKLHRTTYSEENFKAAVERKKNRGKDCTTFESGLDEIIIRRMSRCGMGKHFAWSDRLRGGRPGDLNAWISIVNEIPRLSFRLKRTVIRNDSYLYYLSLANSDTLVYLDPPYLHMTRVSTDVYNHEMTMRDHIDMLENVVKSPGKIIISGYPSELYDYYLKGWKKAEKIIANHSSQKKVKGSKTEILWMNYNPPK